MGREWKVRRGNQKDEMRGQKRGATLITPALWVSLWFNGLSFKAGTNSTVLRTDTMLSLHTDTSTYSTCSLSLYQQASGQCTPSLQSIWLIASFHMGYWSYRTSAGPVVILKQPSSLLSSLWSQAGPTGKPKQIYKRFWCYLDFMIKNLRLIIDVTLN